MSSSYLKEIFSESASNFKFIKRVENPKEFVSNSDENGLKVLLLKRFSIIKQFMYKDLENAI